MSLLGMLAAGAAQGARDASVNNTKAQNVLEIELQREALRNEFYNHRYQQKMAVNTEMVKNKALLDQKNYERNRADKLQDEESKHGRNIELEKMKNARVGSSNAARLEAARIRAGSGTGVDGASGFSPKSPEGKAALDLLNSGRVKSLDEGYDEVNRMKLMHGLTTNQFLEPNKIFDLFDTYNSQRRSRQGQSDPVHKVQGTSSNSEIPMIYNPETGQFK